MAITISSADASSAYQSSGTSSLQQRRQEFQALGQALQAGDQQGAQKAFAALNPNASGSTQSTQSGNSNFSQLAQALQSGDLAGAQKAFAAIASHHGHHHHRQDPAAASQASPTSPTSTSASTVGSNINIAA